ncbi:MAG: response regulator [Muricoprocola sp.]
MIKVFLVEDEVVIRNGIKNNIPWEQEGFQFVGEASDGELAYPLIKKEKPDILITDIRMPFMDGLELSRLVKKELPQIKIIILSGYNEFDYAKEAINIGVTEYLLKPISSGKLLEAVKKVAQLVEQEQEQEKLRERYQKEMEEDILMEKHKLWNVLAYNKISTANLLEQGQKLGMDFTASAYIVFLFKVMQDEDSMAYAPGVLEVSDKVSSLAHGWEMALDFDRSPEGWAFLVKGQSDEDVKAVLETCRKQLCELLEAYPNVRYYGGIGSVVHRIGDIRKSYQEASKAFAGRFFTSESKLIEYKDLIESHSLKEDKIDISQMHSKKSERELVEKFLKSGAQEEVESFLEKYFENIGEQNLQSLLFRQYTIMDLFFTVTDFLKSMDMDLEALPEKCRDINEMIAAASAREADLGTISKLMQDLFSSAMELRDGHAKKKYSVLIEEAKTFIQNNYPREDMSLNTVAAQVNISPSYFSTIFSGETGQTFVEYLTSVRLEKAKELLMCSSLRTAEVGYEVGYRDSHYFSYIFKKVVGCSPKEYKNRGKEQG